MNIHIRKATEDDFRPTEHLTREAFWNIYKPGCDEHLVLHNIRKRECHIGELDLVAVSENQTVGHIISTRAVIVDSQRISHEVLCVGPVSVLPEIQNSGIGSALIQTSIETAERLGYKAMILYGNPYYYHRFGFRNAQEYGITTSDGQNFDPFMALELLPNGLDGIHGCFFEDEAFRTDPYELDEFEKQFPLREKIVTDTQLKL